MKSATEISMLSIPVLPGQICWIRQGTLRSSSMLRRCAKQGTHESVEAFAAAPTVPDRCPTRAVATAGLAQPHGERPVRAPLPKVLPRRHNAPPEPWTSKFAH